MEERDLKYDPALVRKVRENAKIIDHVQGAQRFGRYYYVKCPKCGEFGKVKGKVKGMKITDTSREQSAHCFGCGFHISGAISAVMEFDDCSYLEAVERCAERAGIYLETTSERRQRLAREAAKNEQESFVSRQLKASGLTFADTMARITNERGETDFAQVFTKGSLNAQGFVNPDDDEMLIHYYDLFGKKVTYATRSNGTGVKPYVRIRWALPSLHTTVDGKEIKYQTPKGAKARFYIPQKIRDLFEASVEIETLIIQEGEKKAEKACKHGIPSIGIQGIYNIGNPQDGLMKELSYLVQKCKVKNVVLLFDSDWDALSSSLTNGGRIDSRPMQFCKAAIKFRNYVESLHNEGIHVDVWFAHLNSKDEKGIDDLLAGSLKGKEEKFRESMDVAMHAHDGRGELANFHRISSLTDYQVRDFWHLNKFEDFVAAHADELKDLESVKCMNAFYVRNDKGAFEAKTAGGDKAEFWTMEIDDEKGKVNIEFDPVLMVDFLSANGFKTIRSLNTTKGSYDLVRLDSGVLTPTSIIEIKRYIGEFVGRMASKEVHRKLLNDFPKIVSPDKVMTLPEIADTTSVSWPNLQVFCYKSGFVAVSPDGIEVNAPGHLIWEENVIQRRFKRIPIISRFDYSDGTYALEFTPEGLQCEFLRYLQCASNMWKAQDGDNIAPQHFRDWQLHIINKMTCLGYLLHFFRPMNEAKAVIAMDYVESAVGDSNGRSGKSLFGMAIDQMIPQATVDGKNFDPKFMLSSVTPRTRNIFIDDVNTNFNFSDLYSAITSKMVINVKQGEIFEIPRELAPKILITTNHAIKGDAKSTEARKCLMGFSDYFNSDYSPADMFGHCLFSEWDEDQWLLFDNFMLECVWLYLRVKEYRLNASGSNQGLIDPPLVNLRHRELRQGMGESFLDWAKLTFDPSKDLGRRLVRKELYGEYQAYDKQGARYVNAVEFKKRIVRFCEYMGYHLNPGRKDEKTGATFDTWTKLNPGKTFIGESDKVNGVEYFTISADGRPPKPANPFPPSDPFADMD